MNDQITLSGEVTPPAPAGLIKESSTQDFMADVIEASRERPVLVDFWAPWCGPCKQLTPMLEQAVQAANGAIALVKINIDENQAIAGQLGVKSIPAVFAFKDGQPVDGFMGALQESELKDFISRIAGDPEGDKVAEVLEAANAALADGNHDEAAQMFATIIQAAPDNADAIGGLARCFVELGELERAKETIALAKDENQDHAAISGARSAIELAESAADAGDVSALQASVDSNPGDHQARFDLAIALNANGNREGATDALVEIISRDREWNDDGARVQLLKFFEGWGQSDEATIAGRRKLSSVLFS